MLAQKFQRRLAMPRDSIGLKVCLVGRAFVPFHPEPFQVRELFLERFLRRSLNIGVVDAQNKCAAVVPRVQIREQPRANVADVQRASRTRRETRANRHVTPTRSSPAAST